MSVEMVQVSSGQPETFAVVAWSIPFQVNILLNLHIWFLLLMLKHFHTFDFRGDILQKDSLDEVISIAVRNSEMHSKGENAYQVSGLNFKILIYIFICTFIFYYLLGDLSLAGLDEGDISNVTPMMKWNDKSEL